MAKPASRRRKRTVSPAMLGFCLLGVLLLGVGLAPQLLQLLGRAPGEDYSAGGYTRMVNRLIIARNWLVVDYRNESAPKIRFADDALARDEALRTFVKKSFLRRDMESADPGVWVFDDEGHWVENIRPEAHRVIGPFADVSGWTGDVQFRGRQAPMPVIFDQNSPGVTSRYMLSLDAPVGRRPAIEVFRRSAAESSLLASRFELRDEVGSIGDVILVGDRVFFRATVREGVKMSLEGGVITPKDGRPRVVHWPEGETLTIQKQSQRRRFTLSSASSAISGSQGGRLRLRYPGLESFASGIESSMGAKDGRDDIHTTLDGELQATAQRALERQAEALRGGRRAFPGAVLMMDGLTGDILAIASYPSKPEHLDPESRWSVQPPAILTRNQNFVRLPIGSVAKAPISLAILQQEPALATLRITPQGEFESVLGVDLGATFTDHVGGEGDGLIGFERFLAGSSNRYAAGLMLMGLKRGGAEPLVREPYGLGGQTFYQAPHFPIRDGGVRDATYNIPWKANLKTLFDIAPDGAVEGEVEQYDSVRLWGPLAARSTPFRTVSPEREAFGLNDVRHVGTDYVMTILGGNRSRWTTVKVAESFSRMVGRRPVAARIHDRSLRLAPTAVGGTAFISDEAWTPLMAGLKAVARPGGTAGALDGAVPALGSTQVRIFAKTGTPNLERFVGRTARNEALQEFAAAHCGLILAPHGLALEFAPRARNVAALRSALAHAPDGCARSGGVRDLIAREIVRLNRSPGALRDGLKQQGPAVVSVPIERQAQKGMGHVIAVVVAVYASENDPDDRPVRMLTIVVNLQNRLDSDKRPALDTALELLRDPVVRAWLRHTQQRPVPVHG